MSCPTPGPEDVWFPPSCLARSYRSAGWRAPVPPCGIPAPALRPGPCLHTLKCSAFPVISYMRSDWEGLLIWIRSPPHFGSPADRAGSSSSALDPAYILQPKYSWNSSRSRTGASRGDALPISAPSRLLSLEPGEEVCVCVWECWTERQRQTQRQTARDTDRWLHRWAGLCQRLVRWVFLPILLLPSLVSRPLPSNIYWVPTVLQPHTRWLAHLYVSLKLSSLLMSRLG